MDSTQSKPVYHPTKYSGVEYYIKKNGDKSYRVKYYDSLLKKQITKNIGLHTQGIRPADGNEYIANNRRSGIEAKKDNVTFDFVANLSYECRRRSYLDSAPEHMWTPCRSDRGHFAGGDVDSYAS